MLGMGAAIVDYIISRFTESPDAGPCFFTRMCMCITIIHH